MCGQVGKCGGHLSGDVKYPGRIAVLETMVQMEILLRSLKNTVGKERPVFHRLGQYCGKQMRIAEEAG